MCEILYKENFSKQDRTDFLAMMLSCSNIFPFTAKLLWSNFGPDPYPLLAILDTLCDHLNDLNASKTGTFAPDMRESVLSSNLPFYTSLVRKVVIGCDHVGCGALSSLSALLGEPVFPSVRDLSWSQHGADCKAIRSVLSPSLRSLSVEVINDTQFIPRDAPFSGWVDEMCTSVALLSPNITRLHIGASVKLSIRSGSLGRLKSLKELVGRHIHLHSHGQAEVPLPCLEAVSVSSALQRHSILNSVQDLFSCPCLSLRTVTIESSAYHRRTDHRDFIEYIRPLLLVHGMEQVSFKLVRHVFRFTDEHLKELVKTWPLIRGLHMSFVIEDDESAPCLVSLGYIAHNCTRLRVLSLPAWETPKDCLPFSISAPPNHPLEELRAMRIQFADGGESASGDALRHAFPALRSSLGDGVSTYALTFLYSKTGDLPIGTRRVGTLADAPEFSDDSVK
ncbi:hypothetical protein K466DRAFT_604918 [Polyporus arcularius HHB13444]|uniref:F-box domain-containing protein n=1 Tax=Polyporus arcularius HHB13444 TaxID=1314778 RepID=A0A5C3NWL8_9APHY|nr:hypothetical protein K466DRAFT_604918 [Polyporus arcularius HHB13444]